VDETKSFIVVDLGRDCLVGLYICAAEAKHHQMQSSVT